MLLARIIGAGPMHDPDVILRINGDPNGHAHHPVVRQWLWPKWVDFETRSARARRVDRGAFGKYPGSDCEGQQHRYKCCGNGEMPFHGSSYQTVCCLLPTRNYWCNVELRLRLDGH